MVSLTLGLMSILKSSADTTRTLRRDDAKRRADAYVEVLRIVETRGLAVQDQMWNFTETEDPAYNVQTRRRKVDAPPRSDRANARALLAAYGTHSSRAAFERWIQAVDSWENKMVDFQFQADYLEPPELHPDDAEPERTDERTARDALGEVISREVGGL